MFRITVVFPLTKAPLLLGHGFSSCPRFPDRTILWTTHYRTSSPLGPFGTLSVQLYLYFEAFPNDRPFTKCLVYGVYTLEFAQTMFFTHDVFATFGYGFADVSALANLGFDWLTIAVMGGLVALTGQSFYAYRLYLVSESRVIPVLILILSVVSIVGAFLSAAFSFDARNTTHLVTKKTSAALGVWLGGSALSDVMIALCMTYYLSKKDTGFRKTRVLISKLIRLSIETGSVTALATLSALVLFNAFPDRPYYLTPGIIIPKLYANTMFAVLNARIRILGARGTYAISSDMMSIPSHLRSPATERSPVIKHSGFPRFVSIHRECRRTRLRMILWR
ncbi:hypothetical protein B0H17DRAFT_1339278 [Mycena rosella]|uniref:DUF6534 domain-containing protein n=1 Tax=Mycena rosella TaxID=1033263 RepID=A0AAD7C6P4_MYCRO|nr:hypothetical protein B0H17DRAFT_1339278 [Mycena rosella]